MSTQGPTSKVLRIVHHATSAMKSRVNAMVMRAAIDAIDDSTQLQSITAELLADELLDEIEHFNPGGLSSLPNLASKAEGVVLCVGGSRENAVAVGVSERQWRPTGMLPGETALYRQSSAGIGVYLDAAGVTHLGAKVATDFVALASLTLTELTKIATAHDGHAHPTAGTGAPSPPTMLVGPVAPVAAVKTKAT